MKRAFFFSCACFAVVAVAAWAEAPVPLPVNGQCPAMFCPACPVSAPCPSAPVCKDGSVGTPLPLGRTLWKISSAGWDGFIDFRPDGVYFTHWGLGHWTLRDDVISMRNDYDGFTFELRLKGGTFSGRRNDGSATSGSFLGRYGNETPR